MKFKHLFSLCLILSMLMAFMCPEMKAQGLIKADSLVSGDSSVVVVVSPWVGDIYLDIFPNGVKKDSVKVYEVPYGCDTGTSPVCNILFAENQLTFTNDSLLITDPARRESFHTWKIKHQNPYALKIVRCNDSGMATHTTKFRLKAEHKYQWNMNFKFPDEKYFAGASGRHTFELYYKLTAGHENLNLKESFIINRREFANGLSNRCDTGSYPQFRILFAENQAAVASNILTIDSQLVNIKTHQGTFNTWKILDRNPYALMIRRCNDSGMAGHPTHFKIRAEHKWQWNMNFKFPDEKYFAGASGRHTFELYYKLTAGHKNLNLKESFIIYRSEFANGLTNRLRL